MELPTTLPLLIEHFFSQAWVIGLAALRIASAFAVMPLFSQDIVPAMVRNALCVSFGLLAYVLQPPDTQMVLQAGVVILALKEILIGCTIGFLFGSVLWAFEAAGQIIDNKVGTSTGQIVDPLTGQQQPMTAAFLSRMANFVFMFSGGFLLLMGTLLESYAMWPLMSLQPVIPRVALTLFESEFGRLMVLTLMIAAPVMVVLFAVDGVLGLVNRYAPSLNLFSLAGSLKTWISTVMVMVLLSSMIEQLVADIQSRPAIVLRSLRALFGV
jgi:type III secretion protein T